MVRFGEINFWHFFNLYTSTFVTEHKALLGSINMSSINWFGSLRYYSDIEDLNSKNSTVTKETYDGCGDAAFLAQDRFVVVGDKGAVEVFEVVQQTTDDHQMPDLQSIKSACYHDDSVYTVSVFSDSVSIVTGGLDCW